VELVNDIVFVALTIGFFALAALLVRACDQIIGEDEPSDGNAPLREMDPTSDPSMAATTPEVAR